MSNIYHLSFRSILGELVPLGKFKGKKLLIVNTASECGFTPQYQQLQELHEMHSSDLVVLGFPCNDFGGQEPSSEAGVVAFCTKNYGVTFTLSEKVNILKAPLHPVYEWLTKESLNGVGDVEVTWNFQKLLIDENGQFVQSFAPGVSPLDDAILDWVNN